MKKETIILPNGNLARIEWITRVRALEGFKGGEKNISDRVVIEFKQGVNEVINYDNFEDAENDRDSIIEQIID